MTISNNNRLSLEEAQSVYAQASKEIRDYNDQISRIQNLIEEIVTKSKPLVDELAKHTSKELDTIRKESVLFKHPLLEKIKEVKTCFRKTQGYEVQIQGLQEKKKSAEELRKKAEESIRKAEEQQPAPPGNYFDSDSESDNGLIVFPKGASEIIGSVVQEEGDFDIIPKGHPQSAKSSSVINRLAMVIFNARVNLAKII